MTTRQDKEIKGTQTENKEIKPFPYDMIAPRVGAAGRDPLPPGLFRNQAGRAGPRAQARGGRSEHSGRRTCL